MAEPVPFTIHYPESAISDLKQRLARTRYADQLVGAEPFRDPGWDYGTESSYLKDLAHYWETEYDFRKQEAYLNTFKHFKLAGVNGIDLHFIHERSSDPDAIPLLLLHGWPGSIFEFHKVIEPLVQPSPATADGRKAPSFNVVVPSLPGYGFSSAPQRPGFGVYEMGKTVNELMLKLGYSRYVAQGGDWGGVILSALGQRHGQHCAAILSNICFVGPAWTNPVHLAQLLNMSLPLLNRFPLLVTRADVEGVKQGQEFLTRESGYMRIQQTKPQTVGAGLNDSPAGLLAWIVEKFQTWSDCDGSVETRFTRDELLTAVGIYWFNANITSSQRLYYEFHNGGEMHSLQSYVKVPTGFALFPKDIMKPPRNWAAAKFNIKSWVEFPKGGHFAAMEEPEALLGECRKFFSQWH